MCWGRDACWECVILGEGVGGGDWGFGMGEGRQDMQIVNVLICKSTVALAVAQPC